MHIESERRLNRIKSRVLEGKAALSGLEEQLSHISDKYITELLRQSSYWLNDVEGAYLAMLKREQTPPRSLQEESLILDSAEIFLEDVAMPAIRGLQDLVSKYGPNLMAVGD